jgi:hypothetical protein
LEELRKIIKYLVRIAGIRGRDLNPRLAEYGLSVKGKNLIHVMK